MNDQLLKIFNRLREIKPDSEYAERSKFLILLTKPVPYVPTSVLSGGKGFRFVFKIAAPAVVIGVLIITIFWGASYINQLFFPFFAPNQKNLIAKAEEINSSIQIKLKDIKYYIENQPIDPLTAHVFQSLLDKADKNLRAASELSVKPENLEEALNKIKDAETAFLEMNAMLQNK